MADGQPAPGSLWFYAPNKAASIIFAVIFAITGSVHLWQCIRYKSFKITALHPFFCTLYAVGFGLRAYGAFDYDNMPVFLASQILLYCGPPVLELANFHVLGRILFYVPYFSPMHPGRTLTTFGFISTVVEVLNALGVSWIANPVAPDSLYNTGHALMKASLFVQIGVIAMFCYMAFVFQRRCIRGNVHTRAVRGPLITMYISMLLILIRCIYRIVEHFNLSALPRKNTPGFTVADISPLIRYEWFFYVFEATLMLLNSVLWNVRHPRRYLPEDYHVYLAQDGKTEVLGPGWQDNVPWIVTFIDPFGILAQFLDKKGQAAKQERPFWETNGFESESLVKGQGQGHRREGSDAIV